MIIQAFIPDWNSPRTHSYLLREQLSKHCDTQILKSYDVPFSIQWEEAVSKLTGDVMLWAMADVFLPDNLSRMFESMRGMYNRGDIAMYAPNLDWTSMVCNSQKLPKVDAGVYEVPGTDLVFASMSKELLAATPPLGINTHGWGYDYLLSYIANWKLGKKVVRDYNFLIQHPYGKAYLTPEAESQMISWMKNLPTEYQVGIHELQDIQARVSA